MADSYHNLGAYAAPSAVNRSDSMDMPNIGAQVSGGVSLQAGGAAPRVATLIVAAGAGLFALRLMGFRFNVGVTS